MHIFGYPAKLVAQVADDEVDLSDAIEMNGAVVSLNVEKILDLISEAEIRSTRSLDRQATSGGREQRDCPPRGKACLPGQAKLHPHA